MVALTPEGWAEGWQVIRPWGVLHDSLGSWADRYDDPEALDLAWAVHRQNVDAMVGPCGSYAKKCPDRISRNDDQSVGIMRVVPRLDSKALVERRAARELSCREALDHLDHLDTFGVVHLVGGRSIMPRHLCNCSPCCCGVFNLNRLSMPGLGLSAPTRSRFRSQLVPETCSGCASCVARCPNGAISTQPVAGENRS